MTTRKQADDLRGKLMSLVREGTDEIRGVFGLYSPEYVQSILPSLITPTLDRASILTADWYQNLSDKPFRVREFFPVSEGRINYTSAWAYKLAGEADPVEHMAGAFQRMVFDCGRQTVIGNAKLERVKWERDANEDSCPFCRLLTVDPHAYNGKYVDMPSHNHDCRCIAVASRDGNPYIPPAYVQTWRDEHERKKTGNLTETLAAMEEPAV